MTDFPPTLEAGPVINEPLQATLTTNAEPVTDTWTVRLVVIGLVAIAVAGLIIAGVLAFQAVIRADEEHPIDPSVALIIGSFTGAALTCIGSISAILASTRGLFTKNV